MSSSSLLSPCIQTLLHNEERRLSPSPHQTPPTLFKPPIPRPTPTTFTPSLSTHLRQRRAPTLFRCSTGGAAASGDGGDTSTGPSSSSGEGNPKEGFWSKWKVDTAEMRSGIAKLGLAAVLAYGLFDGVTYTSFFVLAFLGYEKSTGKNPAANLQALLGIVVLMWTGNNVTRPFRVAGAAALAPVIDKGLKKIRKYLNLPNQVYAFALVVSIVAGSCFTIVGLLVLSRWGK